jgi:hypothetical protein
MTSPALNPLSFNAWVQAVGVMSVALTQNNAGVWGFVDAPLQTVLPQILSYAEGRIQRDIDALQARSSNTYALTVSNNLLSIPVNDFLVLETLEVTQVSGAVVVNSWPLIPVSKEFIQNCYSGVFSTGMPKYYAMYGDTFGDGANTNVNVLLGPAPNFAYPVRVTGVIRMPSLYQFATAGSANTSYTYISQWLPDLLLMASMIFISGYQRNFSANSDSPDMPVNYEKQYRTLLAGAIAEENRKKGLGSGYSAYSTPATATPTR